MYETPLTALVLSGGGARAAYQVGVLRALARIRREALGPMARLSNPFGVICGTSAGAINAAALAANADRFEASVEVLAKVWQNFGTEQVYRSDSLGVIRSGAQWLTMMSVGWSSPAGAAPSRDRCWTTRPWHSCCSAWCRWSGCR